VDLQSKFEQNTTMQWQRKARGYAILRRRRCVDRGSSTSGTTSSRVPSDPRPEQKTMRIFAAITAHHPH
jgi:hypothetical protein